MLSMAASSRVWMFWRHCSRASRPRRPSASSSLSSSSDIRERDGGGGGIDDTGGGKRRDEREGQLKHRLGKVSHTNTLRGDHASLWHRSPLPLTTVDGRSTKIL